MIEAGSRQCAGALTDTRETQLLARLAIVGLALVAAQVALIWSTLGLDHATATSVPAVLPLIVGLGVPTALLLAFAPRMALIRPCPRAVLIIFLAGLAMRAVWIGAPAPVEDDFQRYLWDGAVVASGLDPYSYPPERFLAPETVPHAYGTVAKAGQETLKRIYFPDLRTIYPSVAQLSFAVAHVIAPFEIDGLRLVFILAEVLTFLLLLSLLSTLKISLHWSLLYWWNPTVAFSLIGLAHVDALIPAFVLGALLMSIHHRTYLAVALLGAAAGVKIWPALLAPLVLARAGKASRQVVASGLLVAVLGVAIGPVVLSTLSPNSGLAAYALNWGNNNAFYAWATFLLSSTLSTDIAQPVLRVFLAVGALATALVVARRFKGELHQVATGFLVVAATVFYLSPVQFPWYATWFLPLAALTQCWPLLVASATLPIYYLFYPLWSEGRGDLFFFGVAFLHSVPILSWLAIETLLRTVPTASTVARR